jgi:hypothetical protein
MSSDNENRPSKPLVPARHTRSLGSGKMLGRPRTRAVPLKAVPTRCPSEIYRYLKGLSPFLGPSLTNMFEEMMTRFIDERPWDHGLLWRKPKTAMTFAGGKAGRTGWEQVNIQLEEALAEKVRLTALACNQSRACFCYTAMFWWVQYIYPPNKQQLLLRK